MTGSLKAPESSSIQRYLDPVVDEFTTGEYYREVFAAEAVALNDYPEAVPVAIQAYRIGDIAIVGIPCEVFAQIGLDIRRASPLKNQFTISLANGYNGYLPTPEQHAVGGYETWRARSSYLEVEASVKISKAVDELLAKLAK